MAIHSCPDCGIEHGDPDAPVIVEEAPDTEPIADAQVEVARIEADRDVKVAKIQAHGIDEEVAAQLAAMQARIDVLEAAAAPAEPDPEPVVVEAPPAEPEPAPTDPPKREESDAPAEPKPPARKRGFF